MKRRKPALTDIDNEDIVIIKMDCVAIVNLVGYSIDEDAYKL